MYLSELKLWNFRKYGSNELYDWDSPSLMVSFNPNLNVLIGENDSGKTAIIDAIKLTLKTTSYEWIRIEEDDFYQDSNYFRIEITFSDLTDAEASQFNGFLKFDNEDPCLRLIYHVTREEGNIVSADLKAGETQDGNILPGSMRDYLKATYLKPLRDAASELIPKRNSRFSQILREHEAFVQKDKEDHLLVKDYKDFNKRIEEYFDGKVDGKEVDEAKAGKEIKDSINQSVKSFFEDDTSSKISATEPTVSKILESLHLSIDDITNPGLGSLNRLFIATELLHLNKKDWNGLRLGLIEELEAHLHPQTQHKVMNHLTKQNDIQLILTTHSPNLASKVPLEHIILCKGKGVYPMGADYTMLDESDYNFLEKFLDVTQANLFFSRKLIFVEGWSEELLLPSLGKLFGQDFIKDEISVINVRNLAFSRYYKIFQRKDETELDVKISVIQDVDVRPYKYNSEKESIEKVDISEQLISKKTEMKSAFVDYKNTDSFPSHEWTLEWCLAKSPLMGPLFMQALRKVHSTIFSSTKFSDPTDEAYLEELATRLLLTSSKKINKTELAHQLVILIDDACTEHISQLPEERREAAKANKEHIDKIDFEEDEYIAYLREAIEHVY